MSVCVCVNIETEEAELLWVYVLGGALGIWILVIIACVLCRVKDASDVE